MDKIKNFILLHPDLFTFIGLWIVFYVVFFHNIGNYALMDVDESRYVLMAKDMFNSKEYLTLYLNNEYFFEKPPLYFWGECLSFALFGKINEFTARFPVALYGSTCCYLIYLMGKKIVSRAYGVISSLILATSLEYVILAKFAILDIVVTTCIAFSLCFGLVVYFCRESRKKYYWWLFYIFSALAVMAKGIPGVVIPFGSMFVIALISKKLKDVFKPIYIIPGLILFLGITLPWHIIMLKQYNLLFWNEYIIKHHLSRFLGSVEINRGEPFYFYFVTLMWGFFPWVVSCLAVWISKLIKVLKFKNFTCNYENLSSVHRFLLYNSVIVVFILLFFSFSETKLITYILPIYGALSCLGGYVWWGYITHKKYEKLMNNSLVFLGITFILISIAALLTPLYLPKQLYSDIMSAKTFCILIFFATGLALILFTKRRLYINTFASLVLFMALCSAVATEKFFEIDYKFGQDDLIKFAQYAKENNYSLTTFSFGKKYSLLYYGEQPVVFGTQLKPKDLEKTLDKDNDLVIVKIKDLNRYKEKSFDIIETGRKYALIEEKGENYVSVNK